MYDHETGWAGRAMGWLRALTGLILVNLLFILGTLAGLVLLGFFPAAVAAQHVFSQMRSGRRDVAVLQEYVHEYRAQFRRANMVGAPFWAVAALLFLDAAALSSGLAAGPLGAVMTALLLAVGALGFLVMLCAITITAGRQESAPAIWRYALALPPASPGMSISLLLAMAALALAMGQWTVLIPLAGASLPLFAAGWVIDHRLASIDAKQQLSQAITT